MVPLAYTFSCFLWNYSVLRFIVSRSKVTYTTWDTLLVQRRPTMLLFHTV